MITNYYFFKLTVFILCVLFWSGIIMASAESIISFFNFKNILLGRFYKIKYNFFKNNIQLTKYFLLKSEADSEWENNSKKIYGTMNFLSCFGNDEEQIKYCYRTITDDNLDVKNEDKIVTTRNKKNKNEIHNRKMPERVYR